LWGLQPGKGSALVLRCEKTQAMLNECEAIKLRFPENNSYEGRELIRTILVKIPGIGTKLADCAGSIFWYPEVAFPDVRAAIQLGIVQKCEGCSGTGRKRGKIHSACKGQGTTATLTEKTRDVIYQALWKESLSRNMDPADYAEVLYLRNSLQAISLRELRQQNYDTENFFGPKHY